MPLRMHITACRTMAINIKGKMCVRWLGSDKIITLDARMKLYMDCLQKPNFYSAGIENVSVNNSVDLDWQ